jgi:cyclopropane fatty-acyl-phospholipid synthase-like methyltransferase
MDEDVKRSVAESLEMTTGMLPFVPPLLDGMWALGCSPELVVEMLRPLGLSPAETRVLDLGCGKGAAAVTLAKEFGFNALGIDACEFFLDEARKKAEELAVSHLCRFELKDLRNFVSQDRDFDVVIFASLGGLLGNYAECVAALRRTLRPGGYILIDDGFLSGGEPIDRAGYGHYAPHAETLRQLTSQGDILVEERLTIEETRSINLEYMDLIRRNGEKLIRRRPDIKDQVHDYIRSQEVECEIIEHSITGAIWLLQKSGS